MTGLSDLNINELTKICEYLSISEFLNLCSTSTDFFTLINNSEIWKNFIWGYYWSRVQIEGLIVDSGITQLNQTREPQSWKEYTREIFEIPEEAKDMEIARSKLEYFQQNPSNIELLLDATYIGLNSLVDQNLMSFYTLAFICYILNNPRNSLVILDMGLELDPTFEPLIELKAEVQSLFEQLEGQGKLPLTSGNSLSSQFDNILTEIFHKFDKDSDKQLNFNELSNLITTINKGAQPPREFILQIINHFATNSPSALSLKGFKNFFLYQSLEDPEEMRNDLTALGYDGNSLAKLEDLMNGMKI